jgi:hypothetical protein
MIYHGFLKRWKTEVWLGDNKRRLTEINWTTFFAENVVPHIKQKVSFKLNHIPQLSQ